jgi:hypothetical protein
MILGASFSGLKLEQLNNPWKFIGHLKWSSKLGSPSRRLIFAAHAKISIC